GFARRVRERPPRAPRAPPEPGRGREGRAATAGWLAAGPAGAPLALDGAGESTPPTPRIASLAIFHPPGGPAEIDAAEPPSSLGERGLIIHDAQPLLQWWLQRGLTPPPLHHSAGAPALPHTAPPRPT